MLILLAILAACVSMLVTFSLPWSLVLFTRGTHGEISWFWNFLGILGWLGIYLLPFSLVSALAIVWPFELLARRAIRMQSRKWIRIKAWMAIALAVYVAIPSAANPDVMLWAIVCGSGAGAAATLVFAYIVREPNLQPADAADGNQPASTH